MLDRLLEPVGRALSREAARRFVGLKADKKAQKRIDYLAERANEGKLSDKERHDYESLIAAAGVLAILQSKARIVLARANSN